MPRDLETLFREHGGRIYSLLFRLTGNPEDAADLTQDVFLKAQRALPKFEGRSSESTWLIRIAINASRDWHRRSRRSPRSIEAAQDSGSVPEPIDPAARSDRELDQAEAGKIVAESLADLDQEARELLLLREAQGMSYQELAEALGVPLGTVQSRLSRAREALRKAVKRRYPDW